MTRQPKYRFHKARNCAVVSIQGRDRYLGVYDSPESWEKYHRLVAEHWASAEASLPALVSTEPITIVELAALYWEFAKKRYVKDGRRTSEVAAIKQALKMLRRLYGATLAFEFSPKKLKAVREAMIAEPIIYRYKDLDPESGDVVWRTRVAHAHPARRTVNKQIDRIKRLFAWAVAEELVNVAVHDALLRVPGLRRNETVAREVARIRPVSQEHIIAVLALVPAAIRAMIEVQQSSSARPQDIVNMRAIDIDRSLPVWEFRPHRYKTEHHNDEDDPDLDRVVYLGPRAQEILQPWIEAQPDGYLFSPIASEQVRNADRRSKRKSPMTPSQAARKPRARKRAPLRCRYDVGSYRRAIRRACLKAGIPIWCPNQLRHSRLSEIRKRFGLEAARVCGGHREIGVTQIYAEQDRDLARKVMSEIG